MDTTRDNLLKQLFFFQSRCSWKNYLCGLSWQGNKNSLNLILLNSLWIMGFCEKSRHFFLHFTVHTCHYVPLIIVVIKITNTTRRRNANFFTLIWLYFNFLLSLSFFADHLFHPIMMMMMSMRSIRKRLKKSSSLSSPTNKWSKARWK